LNVIITSPLKKKPKKPKTKETKNTKKQKTNGKQNIIKLISKN